MAVKTKKYRVLICDDSPTERFRFYDRQFGKFEIHGVVRRKGKFYETDPVDSPEKLYDLICSLRKSNTLPDLVLLDLFYKKPVPNSALLEGRFIKKLLHLKKEFLSLKDRALLYLEPTGIDVLQKIREAARISRVELPVAVYTDKHFNFLPSDKLNLLYKLDAGDVFKDRDEWKDSQITASAEYFRILSAIEGSRGLSGRWKDKIFVSHGTNLAWTKVQNYLEKFLSRKTIELAQNPSLGRTVITKLSDYADQCSHAVIIMTGDDALKKGGRRVRENVMHEIGYFQGRLGHERVILVREEGVSIPSNLGGVVYLQFKRGRISSVFKDLAAELAI
jgi:Predicted nucleotide-binding protein containing TIR-like domain